MKKLVFVALVFSMLACNNKKSGYNISVNLEGATGTIVLEQREGNSWAIKDSATIVNGTAVLRNEVVFPEMFYLSVLGSQAKTVVFVENTKMTVTGKADSITSAKVEGSKTHDEFNSVSKQINSISEKYMAMYQDAQKEKAAGNNEKADELMAQVEELYNSTGAIQEEFVKNNPSSYATPVFLQQISYEKDVEELDILLSGLDPRLDSVSTIMTLKKRIAQLKTVAVGQIAPDFTQNDAEGNPVRFSDIYSQNEYTLLDFWASWCGPCRQENPNVVAVFNDYKGKGFGVFGVSLDRDKAAWLKAIDDDQLTWAHVSDLAYWSNAAAQLYAVNSIPSSLIVDKTGKIIAKNKREKELRETISELLD